jgi:hypothetical protein
MQFGCWRFLRKDQKKDPSPFLSYERKSYCLTIIVAWKQIPVSSVLVHFPSSLDEFIHLFHSTSVLDEFIHSFHFTCVLDEFIHLFHSTCVLDELIHLFHSTMPTQGQQLIMISGHGNRRWTVMEGVNIMVGKCSGDQNLGFYYIVCWYCSYVRTPTAHGLKELFIAVLERFIKPIHALSVYCRNKIRNTHKQ